MEYYAKSTNQRNSELLEMSAQTEKISEYSYQLSKKLVDGFDNFQKVRTEKEEHFIATCAEKEFDRPIILSIKKSKFKMDGYDARDVKLGRRLDYDMEAMNRSASRLHHVNKMKNVLKSGYSWYITLVMKLQDHSKPSHHPVPINCYKYLCVIWQLALRGWTMTPSIYYTLIERIFVPDDHCDIIVHRTLKATREVLAIDPVVFLRFLEDKGIQASPELILEVRNLKALLVRKQRFAMMASSSSVAEGLDHAGLPGSAPSLSFMSSFSRANSMSDNERPTTLGTTRDKYRQNMLKAVEIQSESDEDIWDLED